jgi:hypothetical protein
MASRGYPESSSKGNVITGKLKCLVNHGQSMWDFWWAKWHWDRFFSEYFGFILLI